MADKTYKTYPLTGIPAAHGKPAPLRHEITAWVNKEENKYQVSLFLRAVAKIKAKPVEDYLGYYQLAGIHSAPLVPWDGEGQPDPEPTPPGFCSHNVVTFPTWHRPYMLLYEQVLYENMVELIKGWKLSEQESKTWYDAAAQFRLPYWDWGQKQPYLHDYGIPEICTKTEWDIVAPGGKKEKFPNPMTGFTNPKTDKDGKHVPMGDPSMGKNAIKDGLNPILDPPTVLPWGKCIGTSRYGILAEEPESKWTNGINNWQFSNQGIKNPPWMDRGRTGSGSIADAISRMFTPGYFDSYETFSSTVHNDPQSTSASNYMSIEYIHNIVHYACGGVYYTKDQKLPDHPEGGFHGRGLGHMSDPPVASFDPIFWLNHCNIDRLFAMWQALNWDKWFDKPQKGDAKPTDPLRPFHHDTQKGLWTSERARDWRLSNYNYDDLRDMPPGKPTPEFTAKLRRHVNELYPGTSHAIYNTPFSFADNSTFNDYIINVVYDRYALKGGAYSILFYLGEPTQPFALSKEDPNFIGAVYTFSAPFQSSDDGSTTCANCSTQDSAKILSKAQVPLTLPLVRRISKIRNGFSTIPSVELGALEPDPVEKVLQAGLQWHFVALGGREVEASYFPNTEVAVLKGTGTHPVEGEHIMPRYGGYGKLEGACKGRKLGFGNEVGPNDLIADD